MAGTRRVLPLSLLFTLLFASAGYAQTGGSINGVVVDETGGVLPGVTVDLRAGTLELTTTTEMDGRYRFEDVPPGPAEITFMLINFGTARRDLTVTAGEAQTVDALLRLSLRADVVVTGTRTFRNIADLDNPAENLVGIASAASQGAITAKQLEARPIMRPAEVLETVPGLIASQHSGEGKANQYYLRGFNLDHGSDFAVTLAGIPVNLPTQAHFHPHPSLDPSYGPRFAGRHILTLDSCAETRGGFPDKTFRNSSGTRFRLPLKISDYPAALSLRWRRGR